MKPLLSRLTRSIYALILIVITAAFGVTASGQGMQFPVRDVNNIMYASGLSTTAANNVLYIQNDARSMMMSTGFDSKVKYKSNLTLVKLGIDHAALHTPAAAYVYKVMYEIKGSKILNDSTNILVANDSLVVAFNPDSLSAYQDVQVKVYPGLYNAKLSIVQIYDITTSTPQLLTVNSTLQQKNFFIELSMQYQPYLKTHYLPADMGLQTTSAYDATRQVLKVDWTPATTPYLSKVTPAQYELEWTYTDDYPADGSPIGTPLSTSAVLYDFKNNASRIVTDSSTYSIPVVYPRGYIVYRVRMVRADSIRYKFPIYGIWSLSTSSGTISSLTSSNSGGSKYYYNAAAHLGDSLNWNYSIQFAEGGKYKHVLSYFDGMLKNRQTITRFNSSPGRLLVTENIYDYEGRPAITTLPSVVNTNKYQFVDSVSISSLTHKPYAPVDFDWKDSLCPLESIIPPFTAGSLANRYYSTLNTDTSGMQKYVPRANGYPLLHTELSPGFSDRVDKMGGAGDSLQIGYGHETKNEYVGADQAELNRLMGLNAGFSNFYTKTVSKDPNGQLSMSVKDFRGKPAISALLGASVDTTKHAIMFNDEVPASSKFKEDKLANATQLIVGHQKKYNNNFYMDDDALITVKYEYAFHPFQVCASPYIGLTVKGSYDYSVVDKCGDSVLRRQDTLGATGVALSSATLSAAKSDTLALTKGKYTLDKTLSIATDEIYAAVDSFFAYKPNCTRSEDDFIKYEVEHTPFPCPDTLNDPCSQLEKKMMEELFTDAKYGKYNRVGGVVTGITPSIYDKSQTGFSSGYRYQATCVQPALSQLTINKYGIAYARIDTLPVDTFMMLYTGDDRYTIAKALLPLHPEYCRLQGCFIDTFENRFNAIPDAATAIKYNLFSLDSIVVKDTLLRSKLLASPINMTHISDSLKVMFSGYLRIDTFASEFAFCSNDDALVYGDAKQYFHTDIVGLNFPDDRIRNAYFEKLRTLYLTNRDKYKSIAQTGGGNSCLPCDSNARMTLTPPPLVPIVYNNNGSLSTGPGSLISLFSTSLQSSMAFLLNNSNTPITNSTTIQQYQDSATAQVHRMDSLLSYIAVDSVVSKMVNCYPGATLKSRFKDTLIAMVVRGEVHNGVFLPDQVRYAIVSAGLSLGDLCHPYLFNYDYYDDGIGARGQCKSGTFYDAVRDFLNDANSSNDGINDILKATTDTSAQFTPSWSSTNIFANSIAASLGSSPILLNTIYETAHKTYRLTFYTSGSGAQDSIVVSFRSPIEATVSNVSYPFFKNVSGTTLTFNQVSCFFEDPQAYAEGRIGRFMFRAEATRTDPLGGSAFKVTKSRLLGWNNAKIEMNVAGSNPIATCVPCTQFRTVYQDFKDSMIAYGGYAADHPLFIKSLRNFTNFSLKKVFSDDQYSRFLNSCALADSMTIPAYGGYGKITFHNFPTKDFSLFKTHLYQSDTINVKAFVDHWNPGADSESVIIDYSSIPYYKIKLFNDSLIAAGGVLSTPVSNCIGQLWIPRTNPAGATIDTILAGTTIFTASAAQADTVRRNNSKYPYYEYKILVSGTPTYDQLSSGIAAIRQRLYEKGVLGYWAPNNYATVNEDYYKTEKKELLAYTYAMQQMTPPKVLDTLQDYFLHNNLSAFQAGEVSYNNPVNPTRFTDLFYSDTTHVYHGYVTLDSMLSWTQATLGSHHLFIANTINTSVSSVPPAGSLILYRCSDGLYWYRYFDGNLKLYNVYIRVPKYVYKSVLPTFRLAGIRTTNGDSVSRRFTALLVSASMPGDTVYARGSTDFDISWSNKLSDVLLGSEAPAYEVYAGEESSAYPNCEQDRLYNAIYAGRVKYANYIDSFRSALRSAFYAHVMSQIGEKLWIEYTDRRFAYTLYNYDLAGNLIRTVPPAGVKKLDSLSASKVDSLRSINQFSMAAVPQHDKSSRYEYNTVNKPVREITPDGGVKVIYYDAKGNVILAQNDKQRKTGLFTYSLCDSQNRVTETGEVQWNDCTVFPDYPLYALDSLGHKVKTSRPDTCACENLTDSVWTYCIPNTMKWYDNAAFTAKIRSKPRTQVVATVYDHEFLNLETVPGMSRQENLRSRVAANMYYESCPPGVPGKYYTHATHYSYDIAGNASTVTQDFPDLGSMNQRYKRIDYEYDLQSGKVNMLSYNRGFADQLYQQYSYDADNRITEARTSHDGIIWKRDAGYTYYQHGPLARVSLGDQRVQGLDYAYTLQGWLKAINGSAISAILDMGGDGLDSNITPGDAFATDIDYFKGDYTPIGQTPLSTLPGQTKNLYNGNIARQTTDLAAFGALTTAYTYDQLNRIRSARYAQLSSNVLTFNNWYASSYKYDLDGNLKKLFRNNGAGTAMDSLTYSYPNPTLNNRLADVTDSATFNQPGVEDLKHYTVVGQSRMLYDEIGNLVKDLTSGTDTVKWNIYGKTTDVKDTATRLTLHFTYDGAGQRVSKQKILVTDTGNYDQNTYYVRDASGNILAEYNMERRWNLGGSAVIAVRAIRNGSGLLTAGGWIHLLDSLGYLANSSFATAMVSKGGLTPTYPAGYYLAQDAMLSGQFVQSGSVTMTALCRYSHQQNDYPAADALLAELTANDPKTRLESLTKALFANTNEGTLRHALVQVCTLVPALYSQLSSENDIVYTSQDDSASFFAAVTSINQDQQDLLKDKLLNIYDDDNQSLTPWFRAVTSDSLYITDSWCRGSQYPDNLAQTLSNYGDAAALARAGGDETLKSTKGIYAFASWWPGGMEYLSSVTDTADLLKLNYYDDPVAYLNNYTQSNSLDAVDTALGEVGNLDFLALAKGAGVGPGSVKPELAPQYTNDPQIKYQKLTLASHHIYGSSRLGVIGYWPGQYDGIWDYVNNQIDTSRIGIRQPWYSFGYNAYIRPLAISPYGNDLNSVAGMQHVLGQTQYELTNHLGNVMATVSDKRYIKDLDGDGVRDKFVASIPALYDYYPFGMLMPGRYMADTGSHSAVVSQVKLIPYQVYTSLAPLTSSTGLMGATLTAGIPTGAWVNGVQGGLKRTITVTPGMPVKVYFTIGNMLAGPITATAKETVGAAASLLDVKTVNSPGSYVLSFTPTTSTVTVELLMQVAFDASQPFMLVSQMSFEQTQYGAQNVLVQISNHAKDQYEFGFNGQEKDNEIGGVGNSINYKARMLDPRIARFKSVDPLTFKYPMLTPYQFASNTPIQAIDLDGKEAWFRPTDGYVFYGPFSTEAMKQNGNYPAPSIYPSSGSITTGTLANAELGLQYPAFSPEGKVVRYTTVEDKLYVRFYTAGSDGNDNRVAGWLARYDDIKDLTPEQVKDQLALKNVPNMMIGVRVPKGSGMESGPGAGYKEGNPWGNAGLRQYRLRDIIDEENFKNYGESKLMPGVIVPKMNIFEEPVAEEGEIISSEEKAMEKNVENEQQVEKETQEMEEPEEY